MTRTDLMFKLLVVVNEIWRAARSEPDAPERKQQFAERLIAILDKFENGRNRCVGRTVGYTKTHR